MKVIDSIIVVAILCYAFYSIVIHRPYMKLTVRYKYVPALSNDLKFFRINTHYRGYNVGNVSYIKLSKDQKYVEFHINIYYKGLKLPKNTLFIFKTKNLYGTRYVDIQPIEPQAKELLKNGDVVDGTAAYERFDEYLLEELKEGRTSKILDNLLYVTNIMKESLNDKENEKLLTQSAGDLATVLESVREISEDPYIKRDIRATIKHSAGSVRNIDEMLSNEEVKRAITESPESIDATVCAVRSMSASLNQVSQLMPETSKKLSSANDILNDTNKNLAEINKKVPVIPPTLIHNTNKLLLKTDCFESEISKIMTERFLFLKFLFGTPGRSLKKCTKNECGCPCDEEDDD